MIGADVWRCHGTEPEFCFRLPYGIRKCKVSKIDDLRSGHRVLRITRKNGL